MPAARARLSAPTRSRTHRRRQSVRARLGAAHVNFTVSEEEATAGYEAQPDGRVTLWGDDTGWTTDDLAAQLGRDAPAE